MSRVVTELGPDTIGGPELGPWGHDVPRDWPSWRAQVARHLPRLR